MRPHAARLLGRPINSESHPPEQVDSVGVEAMHTFEAKSEPDLCDPLQKRSRKNQESQNYEEEARSLPASPDHSTA